MNLAAADHSTAPVPGSVWQGYGNAEPGLQEPVYAGG